jgi:hypothetical protein
MAKFTPFFLQLLFECFKKTAYHAFTKLLFRSYLFISVKDISFNSNNLSTKEYWGIKFVSNNFLIFFFFNRVNLKKTLQQSLRDYFTQTAVRNNDEYCGMYNLQQVKKIIIINILFLLIIVIISHYNSSSFIH